MAKIIDTLFWYIKRILKFAGMIDEKGEISRTNLIIYIFTLKFAFVPLETASINDLVLALSAMGIYFGKKVITAYTDTRTNKDIATDTES